MLATEKPKKRHVFQWTIFILILLASVFYIFNTMENTTDTTTVDATENPTVVLNTNLGIIELELFVKESPITAGNFKKLVEEGFYDGTRFHRVIGNFMIQGGDPLSKDKTKQASWGKGGPGYAIEDEFIEGLSISMANSGPQSGGSQFFINLVDNTNLDWDKGDPRSKHPVFGKVVSGMDVVDKVGSVATTGGNTNRPLEDVIIEKATIK